MASERQREDAKMAEERSGLQWRRSTGGDRRRHLDPSRYSRPKPCQCSNLVTVFGLDLAARRTKIFAIWCLNMRLVLGEVMSFFLDLFAGSCLLRSGTVDGGGQELLATGLGVPPAGRRDQAWLAVRLPLPSFAIAST